jgi:fucose 4-O-acetylase-like acetyltransferase
MRGAVPIQAGANDERLGFLDSFRAAAIVMVVAVHALGYSDLDPVFRKVIAFLVHTISVPVFFLVDGYLFAKGSRKSFDYYPYVLRSARRLLIPWVVFTLIYTILRGLFEYVVIVPERMVLGRSWDVVARSVYLSEIAPQMYFLLSLFIVRLLSYGTVRVLRLPGWILAFSPACYVLLFELLGIRGLFFVGLDPILHALWGFQFYLTGVVLYRFDPWIRRHIRPVAAAALGIMVLANFAPASAPLANQYAYLILLYLTFLSVRKSLTYMETVGKMTMGIYLLHAPVILKASSLLYGFLVNTDIILYYILVTVTSVVISLWLTRVVERLPYASWMFGQTPSTLQKETPLCLRI